MGQPKTEEKYSFQYVSDLIEIEREYGESRNQARIKFLQDELEKARATTSYVYVKQLHESLKRAKLTVKCFATCIVVMTIAVSLYLNYMQDLLNAVTAERK